MFENLINLIFPSLSKGFFPLIPLAISGLSALAGGLSNRSQQTQQQQTSTSTPNLDPQDLNFRNQIMSQYLNQLSQGVNLGGYQASGIDDINRNRELQGQQTRENLASRGINGPAFNFALNNINNQRYGDLTRFQQGIPLLQHQLQSDILRNAGGFFSSIPYGQTQTGKGTQTYPGNIAGGALGNLSSVLAYFLGQGAFKPSNPYGTPTSLPINT